MIVFIKKYKPGSTMNVPINKYVNRVLIPRNETDANKIPNGIVSLKNSKRIELNWESRSLGASL